MTRRANSSKHGLVGMERPKSKNYKRNNKEKARARRLEREAAKKSA